MKKTIAVLLTLVACFSLFTTAALAISPIDSPYYLELVEVTDGSNLITPFAYDEHEVSKTFTFNIRSKTTGNTVDTMYVAVVGLVSNTSSHAEITSTNVTFKNDLFYVYSTFDYGEDVYIDIADAIYNELYLTIHVHITPTGTITAYQAA